MRRRSIPRARSSARRAALTIHLAVLATLSASAARAPGQTFTWTDAGGGSNWNNDANWSPNTGVPNVAADTAIIGAPSPTNLDISPTIGTLTVNSGGALNILGGQALTVVDGITGNATITVNSNQAFSGTTLALEGGTLGGSGTLLLNDDAAATTAALDGTFTQSGAHTIAGDGQINAALTNNGTINASIAATTLTLATNGMSNAGVMEATAGTLVISGIAITQGGAGEILANGGTVSLVGASISGGTLNGTGAGIVVGSSAVGTLTNVTNAGAISVVGGGGLEAIGTLTDNGSITINSNAAFSGTALTFAGGTLTGSGTVILNDDAAASTAAINGSLTQGAGHTIQGEGQINAALTNSGTVNASVSGHTLTLTTSAMTNDNVFEATGGGTLAISGITVTQNAAGQIEASGGTVSILDSSILGGTLTSSGGGQVLIPTSESGTLSTVTNTAAINVMGGGTLNVLGTLTDDGTITINSNASFNATAMNFSGGTLAGSGVVVLNDDASTTTAAIDGSFTQNAGHTIQGQGQINGALTNNGTVNANVGSTSLALATSSMTNNSLFEATAGTLAIEGITVTQGPAGQILANGGTVLIADATLSGGTLGSSGGGGVLIPTSESGTLSGVTSTAAITVMGGGTLNVLGTLTDDGTITINSNAAFAATALNFSGGTLAGSGVVVLNDDASTTTSAIDGSFTQGAGHTIEGQGQITTGVINNGTVDANAGAQTLTIAGTSTNNGEFQASNGGALEIAAGELTNFSGTTLTGGTYEVDGNSTIGLVGTITTNAANIVLNGIGTHFAAIVPLATNSGQFILRDGATFTTVGALSSSGTISVGPAVGTSSVSGLTVSGAFSQSGGLTTVNGTFTASPTTIGNGGIATFLQSGSMAVSSLGALQIGEGTLGAGTVSVSGGTLTASGTTIGGVVTTQGFGAGTFLQSGSTTESSLGPVTDGDYAAGYLSLSGGTLVAGGMTVGDFGNGTLVQSGGASTLGALTLGVVSGGGTVLLSGGSLTASSTTVGETTIGALFSQSGGSSSLGGLIIAATGEPGSGHAGTVSLSGGTLVASSTTIAAAQSGVGTFLQSGSLSVSSLGTLQVAAGTTSSGTVTLSAGSLTATSTTIGSGSGSVGSFTESGSLGVSNLGALQVGVGTGSSGTVSLTGGSLTASSTIVGDGGNGTFLQNGVQAFSNLGTLTIGDGSISSGTLTLTLGSLTAGTTFVGLSGGTADFDQKSGTSSLGAVQIAVRNELDVTGGLCSMQTLNNGGGLFATGGTIALTGGGSLNGAPLTTGFTFLGIADSGTFLQSGASAISNLGTLTVGEETGGLGTVSMSGGSLSASSTVIGLNSGGAGAGTFLQSAGSSDLASTGNLFSIGQGSGATGVASLSGGSLTAASTTVGDPGGSGTFLQGGTLSISNLGTLTVGSGTASKGTASLSGGSLTAVSTYVGFAAGVGTFLQGAGSSNLGFVYVGVGTVTGGIGTVSLTGGSLSAANTVIGLNSGSLGAGTFLQSGGSSDLATSGNGFYVGDGTAVTGVASLSGGSLTAVNTFVGFAGGIGTLLQSGTSNTNLGTLSVGVSGGTGYLSMAGGTLLASTTTVSANSTLTISGGNFTTGTISYSGDLSLTGGTLAITGSGTSSLGTVTVGSTATVALSGGTLDVGTLSGTGNVGVASSTLVANQMRVGTLNINSGTVIFNEGSGAGSLGAIHAPTSGTLGTGSVSSVTLSPTSTLNLTTHALVINYNGQGGANLNYEGIPSPVGELTFGKHTPTQSYPAGSITRYIQTAYDNGNWDLPGITSSVAEGDITGTTAVGVVDQNDLFALEGNDYTTAHGGPGTWEGVPVANDNNVLVRYTYYGDTNLDGTVDATDVDNVIQGFEGFGDGWLYGDFNYDGIVNGQDITELIIGFSGQKGSMGDAISPGEAQFLLSIATGITPAEVAKFDAIVGVPEPASITLLGAAALGLLPRRRRRGSCA